MSFKMYIINSNPTYGPEEKESGMKDNVFEQLVLKEVAVKIARRETFTAYDITKALRAWMNADVDHQRVRAVMRVLYSATPDILFISDYEVTTCCLDDTTTAAVYHPSDVDPNDYIATITNQAPTTDDCEKCTCDEKDEKIKDLQRENAELGNLLHDIQDILSGAQF